jgi:tRNA(Ile)-lysidine synthase
MDVLSQVAATIEKHRLLLPGQRLVLGVSGGADSLCALDCLHRLGYGLIVAHLDHQLRRGAWREAERVLSIARDYQLPAVVERQDVRAVAGHGRSIEEAARLVRYDFLTRVAREHKLDVIATGHTGDDQVETILMHLLRGAGPSGLAGMSPDTRLDGWFDLPYAQGLRLIRPLLETRREATQAYCRQAGLPAIADPSNLSTSFFRNRIRLELLPILARYNSSIGDVIRRMGQVMRGHAEFVAAATEEVWPRTVRVAGPDALAVQRSNFIALPRALQRSLVHDVVARLLPGGRDFGFEHIERAVEFAVRPPSGRRGTLPGGLELISVADEVIFVREGGAVALPHYPQLTTSRSRRLRVPGRVKLAMGWSIQAEYAPPTAGVEGLLEGLNAWSVALDRFIADGMSVGPANPGDRLRPFGMTGTTKISDILVDSRVPRIARARWPILRVSGVPIWVAGIRAAEETRLTSTSDEVVRIRLVRPESG